MRVAYIIHEGDEKCAQNLKRRSHVVNLGVVHQSGIKWLDCGADCLTISRVSLYAFAVYRQRELCCRCPQSGTTGLLVEQENQININLNSMPLSIRELEAK
jgi:hypothetical protein